MTSFWKRYNFIYIKGYLMMIETIYSHTLTSWCYLLDYPNNLLHVLCEPNDSRRFCHLFSVQQNFCVFPVEMQLCEFQNLSVLKDFCFCFFLDTLENINNCEYEKYKIKPQNSPLYINTQHSSLLKKKQSNLRLLYFNICSGIVCIVTVKCRTSFTVE